MNRQKITNCSAAILAGGKNSRYGGFHKAFLRIDNELLIQRDLNLLSKIFKEVIIVANHKDIFEQFGAPVFPDIYLERGPLAGIHSALIHATNDDVMIFGCDMPYLDNELIFNIYNRYKNSQELLCVPKNNGFMEPLHGIYSKEILPDIEAFMNKNTYNAIHRFLAQQKVNYVELNLEKRVFMNINSPEDLAKLQ